MYIYSIGIITNCYKMIINSRNTCMIKTNGSREYLDYNLYTLYFTSLHKIVIVVEYENDTLIIHQY